MIQKYLGKDYFVCSSGGHIRELPPKDGSVDTNVFVPTWQLTTKGKAFITELKKQMKDCDMLILATDPDREGEGISWHIYDALRTAKVKMPQVKRVAFNAVTKNDILNAIKNPRDINQDLVNSYLARLMIDYLVGFNLSPVLWRKLPGSRSAGRVQSVALRLIVERAKEIANFIIEEYWTIDGIFAINSTATTQTELKCKLIEFLGRKLDKLGIKTINQSNDIIDKLKIDNYTITSLEDSETKRNPNPPFNTASFQQAAVNELNMRSVNAMRIAQSLYEGVEVNGETVGLITYMRTDSIMINPEAVKSCRDAIKSLFGDKYLSTDIRVYKSKAKNAQESHEAIRPTNILLRPEDVKPFLSSENFAVYDLIWRRTIASQMASAIWLSRNIKITGQKNQSVFSITGSKILFDGFLKVTRNDEVENNLLPDLEVNSKVDAINFIKEQHFTRPPAHYTEATLVKKMEELGIGRPSTYARIFSVLTERNYAYYQGKSIIPESRGMLVVYFLMEYFSKYVEYDFTADMENKLDDISNGSIQINSVMNDFWINFHQNVESAFEIKITDVLVKLQEKMENLIFPNKDIDQKCPKCGGVLELKLGRFGPFIGCSSYTSGECKYMRSMDAEGEISSGMLGTYTENDITYNVEIATGPYGKYIKFSSDMADKPIHVQMTGVSDQISLKDAIFLKNLPIKIGIYNEKDILLCNGRFGPYVKSGDIMASLKKSDDIFTLELSRAIELIEQRASSDKKPFKRKAAPKNASSKKTTQSKKTKKSALDQPKAQKVDKITKKDS